MRHLGANTGCYLRFTCSANCCCCCCCRRRRCCCCCCRCRLWSSSSSSFLMVIVFVLSFLLVDALEVNSVKKAAKPSRKGQEMLRKYEMEESKPQKSSHGAKRSRKCLKSLEPPNPLIPMSFNPKILQP